MAIIVTYEVVGTPDLSGDPEGFIAEYARQTRNLNAHLGATCSICGQAVTGKIHLIYKPGGLAKELSGFCCEGLMRSAY